MEQFKKFKRMAKGDIWSRGVIFCVFVFGVCYWIKKPNPYQEIVILNNQNEVIYPIGVDILNERKVGDFTFFYIQYDRNDWERCYYISSIV